MGAIFNFYFLIFNFISLHNSLDFLERERERERETQAYISILFRPRNLRIKKQTANNTGRQFTYLYDALKPQISGCRRGVRKFAVSSFICFFKILTLKHYHHEM